MSTKALRTVDKTSLTAKDTVTPYRYTASVKTSLSKGRKASGDSYRVQYETQSSFFPQRQDRRDVTARKELAVDPKTGRLSYPSLLFRKKALKESIKKSLSKGDFDEDEVEEVTNAGNYARQSGIDEYRQYRAMSKDIETRQSGMYYHNDAEASDAEDEGRDNEPLENRKYNMYEDWRIIETIGEIISEHGIKGHLSKSLWKNLIDPMTGARLLDGTRTPESMRERYKRWLVLLDEVDKDELRRFARTHSEASMRNSCCIFTKVDDSKKRFDGISEDAIGTYSAFKSINTPRKSSSKKKTAQSARYTQEKASVPKIFLIQPDEENPVREKLLFTERKTDKKKKKSSAKTSRVPTVRKSSVKEKEACSTLKRLYIPVQDDEVETVDKQRVLEYAEKLNKKHDHGEFRPSSKKIQKAYETPEAGRVSYREIPGGKRLDFSQINLMDRLSSVLKGRKYMVEDLSRSEEEEQVGEVPKDLSLSVYVDMNQMVRAFVKEGEEQERRGRHTIKLIKIAEKYGLKLDDALRLFNAVSCDYEDLKLYLQGGDVNLLWTEDDDHGLILNNNTAIRYLKVIKGKERMERRKTYLLGRYERRRASQSAL